MGALPPAPDAPTLASVANDAVKAAGGILAELVGVKPAEARSSKYGSKYDALYRATPEAAGYGPAPVAGVTVNCNRRTPNKVNHFHLFHAMGVEWRGCVEARPSPYDIQDTVPSLANPSTLFVPYLWPDEQTATTSTNSTRLNYLKTFPRPARVRSWGNHQEQAYVWKYWNTSLQQLDNAAYIQQDPNGACPDPVVPLTNNRATLDTAINKLRVYGASGTNSVEGLAWAWRVLTPGAPFTEGGPPDRKRRKIIVLMTDGMNEVVPQRSVGYNRSDYTAVGYADKNRLGTRDIATMASRLDDKLETLCRTVKGRRDTPEEITIYTVLFDPTGAIRSARTANIFRDCATTRGHAFSASSGADLISAFEKIGREISALRLAE